MEEGMGFDDDASVASFDAGAEGESISIIVTQFQIFSLGVYDNNAEFLNSAPPSSKYNQNYKHVISE